MFHRDIHRERGEPVDNLGKAMLGMGWGLWITPPWLSEGERVFGG